jgi:hypothetical protein
MISTGTFSPGADRHHVEGLAEAIEAALRDFAGASTAPITSEHA